jgi:hypothetical protein
MSSAGQMAARRQDARKGVTAKGATTSESKSAPGGYRSSFVAACAHAVALLREQRTRNGVAVAVRVLDNAMATPEARSIRELSELVASYAPPRCEAEDWSEVTLSLGDTLAALGEYGIASAACYRPCVSSPEPEAGATVQSTTGLAVHCRAVQGMAMTAAGAMRLVDPRVESVSGLGTFMSSLARLQASMQLAVSVKPASMREPLYYLVHNGIICTLALAEPLLTFDAAFARRVLPYLNWCILAMEASPNLAAPRHLPLRGRLYGAVCRCFERLGILALPPSALAKAPEGKAPAKGAAAGGEGETLPALEDEAVAKVGVLGPHLFGARSAIGRAMKTVGALHRMYLADPPLLEATMAAVDTARLEFAVRRFVYDSRLSVAAAVSALGKDVASQAGRLLALVASLSWSHGHARRVVRHSPPGAEARKLLTEAAQEAGAAGPSDDVVDAAAEAERARVAALFASLLRELKPFCDAALPAIKAYAAVASDKVARKYGRASAMRRGASTSNFSVGFALPPAEPSLPSAVGDLEGSPVGRAFPLHLHAAAVRVAFSYELWSEFIFLLHALEGRLEVAAANSAEGSGLAVTGLRPTSPGREVAAAQPTPSTLAAAARDLSVQVHEACLLRRLWELEFGAMRVPAATPAGSGDLASPPASAKTGTAPKPGTASGKEKGKAALTAPIEEAGPLPSLSPVAAASSTGLPSATPLPFINVAPVTLAAMADILIACTRTVVPLTGAGLEGGRDGAGAPPVPGLSTGGAGLASVGADVLRDAVVVVWEYAAGLQAWRDSRDVGRERDGGRKAAVEAAIRPLYAALHVVAGKIALDDPTLRVELGLRTAWAHAEGGDLISALQAIRSTLAAVSAARDSQLNLLKRLPVAGGEGAAASAALAEDGIGSSADDEDVVALTHACITATHPPTHLVEALREPESAAAARTRKRAWGAGSVTWSAGAALAAWHADAAASWVVLELRYAAWQAEIAAVTSAKRAKVETARAAAAAVRRRPKRAGSRPPRAEEEGETEEEEGEGDAQAEDDRGELLAAAIAARGAVFRGWAPSPPALARLLSQAKRNSALVSLIRLGAVHWAHDAAARAETLQAALDAAVAAEAYEASLLRSVHARARGVAGLGEETAVGRGTRGAAAALKGDATTLVLGTKADGSATVVDVHTGLLRTLPGANAYAPPLVLSRCNSSITLSPCAQPPSQRGAHSPVAFYALYGKPFATGTAAAASSTGLVGTGVPAHRVRGPGAWGDDEGAATRAVDLNRRPGSGAPLVHSIVTPVTRLVANEAYVFACGAHDASGALIGGAVSLSTPPIIAATPLPLPLLFGYIACEAARVGEWAIARAAAGRVVSQYVSVGPTRPGAGPSPLALRREQLVLAPRPVHAALVRCLLVLADSDRGGVGEWEGEAGQASTGGGHMVPPPSTHDADGWAQDASGQGRVAEGPGSAGEASALATAPSPALLAAAALRRAATAGLAVEVSSSLKDVDLTQLACCAVLDAAGPLLGLGGGWVGRAPPALLQPLLVAHGALSALSPVALSPAAMSTLARLAFELGRGAWDGGEGAALISRALVASTPIEPSPAPFKPGRSYAPGVVEGAGGEAPLSLPSTLVEGYGLTPATPPGPSPSALALFLLWSPLTAPGGALGMSESGDALTARLAALARLGETGPGWMAAGEVAAAARAPWGGLDPLAGAETLLRKYGVTAPVEGGAAGGKEGKAGSSPTKGAPPVVRPPAPAPTAHAALVPTITALTAVALHAPAAALAPPAAKPEAGLARVSAAVEAALAAFAAYAAAPVPEEPVRAALGTLLSLAAVPGLPPSSVLAAALGSGAEGLAGTAAPIALLLSIARPLLAAAIAAGAAADGEGMNGGTVAFLTNVLTRGADAGTGDEEWSALLADPAPSLRAAAVSLATLDLTRAQAWLARLTGVAATTAAIEVGFAAGGTEPLTWRAAAPSPVYRGPGPFTLHTALLAALTPGTAEVRGAQPRDWERAHPAGPHITAPAPSAASLATSAALSTPTPLLRLLLDAAADAAVGARAAGAWVTLVAAMRTAWGGVSAAWAGAEGYGPTAGAPASPPAQEKGESKEGGEGMPVWAVPPASTAAPTPPSAPVSLDWRPLWRLSLALLAMMAALTPEGEDQRGVDVSQATGKEGMEIGEQDLDRSGVSLDDEQQLEAPLPPAAVRLRVRGPQGTTLLLGVTASARLLVRQEAEEVGSDTGGRDRGVLRPSLPPGMTRDDIALACRFIAYTALALLHAQEWTILADFGRRVAAGHPAAVALLGGKYATGQSPVPGAAAPWSGVGAGIVPIPALAVSEADGGKAEPFGFVLSSGYYKSKAAERLAQSAAATGAASVGSFGGAFAETSLVCAVRASTYAARVLWSAADTEGEGLRGAWEDAAAAFATRPSLQQKVRLKRATVLAAKAVMDGEEGAWADVGGAYASASADIDARIAGHARALEALEGWLARLEASTAAPLRQLTSSSLALASHVRFGPTGGAGGVLPAPLPFATQALLPSGIALAPPPLASVLSSFASTIHILRSRRDTVLLARACAEVGALHWARAGELLERGQGGEEASAAVQSAFTAWKDGLDACFGCVDTHTQWRGLIAALRSHGHKGAAAEGWAGAGAGLWDGHGFVGCVMPAQFATSMVAAVHAARALAPPSSGGPPRSATVQAARLHASAILDLTLLAAYCVGATFTPCAPALHPTTDAAFSRHRPAIWVPGLDIFADERLISPTSLRACLRSIATTLLEYGPVFAERALPAIVALEYVATYRASGDVAAAVEAAVLRGNAQAALGDIEGAASTLATLVRGEMAGCAGSALAALPPAAGWEGGTVASPRASSPSPSKAGAKPGTAPAAAVGGATPRTGPGTLSEGALARAGPPGPPPPPYANHLPPSSPSNRPALAWLSASAGLPPSVSTLCPRELRARVHLLRATILRTLLASARCTRAHAEVAAALAYAPAPSTQFSWYAAVAGAKGRAALAGRGAGPEEEAPAAAGPHRGREDARWPFGKGAAPLTVDEATAAAADVSWVEAVLAGGRAAVGAALEELPSGSFPFVSTSALGLDRTKGATGTPRPATVSSPATTSGTPSPAAFATAACAALEAALLALARGEVRVAASAAAAGTQLLTAAAGTGGPSTFIALPVPDARLGCVTSLSTWLALRSAAGEALLAAGAVGEADEVLRAGAGEAAAGGEEVWGDKLMLLRAVACTLTGAVADAFVCLSGIVGPALGALAATPPSLPLPTSPAPAHYSRAGPLSALPDPLTVAKALAGAVTLLRSLGGTVPTGAATALDPRSRLHGALTASPPFALASSLGQDAVWEEGQEVRMLVLAEGLARSRLAAGGMDVQAIDAGAEALLRADAPASVLIAPVLARPGVDSLYAVGVDVLSEVRDMLGDGLVAAALEGELVGAMARGQGTGRDEAGRALLTAGARKRAQQVALAHRQVSPLPGSVVCASLGLARCTRLWLASATACAAPPPPEVISQLLMAAEVHASVAYEMGRVLAEHEPGLVRQAALELTRLYRLSASLGAPGGGDRATRYTLTLHTHASSLGMLCARSEGGRAQCAVGKAGAGKGDDSVAPLLAAGGLWEDLIAYRKAAEAGAVAIVASATRQPGSVAGGPPPSAPGRSSSPTPSSKAAPGPVTAPTASILIAHMAALQGTLRAWPSPSGPTAPYAEDACMALHAALASLLPEFRTAWGVPSTLHARLAGAGGDVGAKPLPVTSTGLGPGSWRVGMSGAGQLESSLTSLTSSIVTRDDEGHEEGGAALLLLLLGPSGAGAPEPAADAKGGKPGTAASRPATVAAATPAPAAAAPPAASAYAFYLRIAVPPSALLVHRERFARLRSRLRQLLDPGAAAALAAVGGPAPAGSYTEWSGVDASLGVAIEAREAVVALGVAGVELAAFLRTHVGTAGGANDAPDLLAVVTAGGAARAAGAGVEETEDKDDEAGLAVPPAAGAAAGGDVLAAFRAANALAKLLDHKHGGATRYPGVNEWLRAVLAVAN